MTTEGQIMSQLKSSLINTHRKLLKILNRVEENIIYLEGGLGSQILGTLEFMSTNKSIDISYFTHPPQAVDAGPDVWKWELSRYGIELNFFQDRVRTNPYKWKYALKPQIQDLNLSTSGKYANPWIFEKGSDLFPIDKTATSKITESHEIEENRFGAIHIRKGDYLRVSSRVIGINENAAILAKLQTQLPKEMFVFSDTPLLAKEISALEVAVPHLNLIFLSEDDLGSGTVHDLMRISKVLITANSTFSFSAGLLSSKETLVYCPLMFFGGQDDYLKSRIFNQSGDYFLMR
jgi:hypothetical protein